MDVNVKSNSHDPQFMVAELLRWHAGKVGRVATDIGTSRPTIYAVMDGAAVSERVLAALRLKYREREMRTSHMMAVLSYVWCCVAEALESCCDFPDFRDCSLSFELLHKTPAKRAANQIGFDMIEEFVASGSSMSGSMSADNAAARHILQSVCYVAFSRMPGMEGKGDIWCQFMSVLLGLSAMSSRNRAVITDALQKSGVRCNGLYADVVVPDRWWSDAEFQVYLRRGWGVLVGSRISLD